MTSTVSVISVPSVAEEVLDRLPQSEFVAERDRLLLLDDRDVVPRAYPHGLGDIVRQGAEVDATERRRREHLLGASRLEQVAEK
jgi:hypothetical protein